MPELPGIVVHTPIQLQLDQREEDGMAASSLSPGVHAWTLGRRNCPTVRLQRVRHKHLNHWDFSVVIKTYPDWYRHRIPPHAAQTWNWRCLLQRDWVRLALDGETPRDGDEQEWSFIVKFPALSPAPLGFQAANGWVISRQEAGEYSGNWKNWLKRKLSIV